MLGHYFRTVVRSLLRSKLVTLLHIVGLTVGLACFILSFVFIEQLRTSDGRFRNSGRIYAVTQQLWMGNNSKPVTRALPQVTAAAAAYLKSDFPQLEAVARAMPLSWRVPASVGDRNVFLYEVAVDPDFFKIFDLPFVAGDRTNPLASADGAVITEAAARRLFGTTDVVGRRVLLNNVAWITIKAVIAGVPQPSHMGDTNQSSLRFDILVRLTPLFGSNSTDWTLPATVTYVLLPAHGRFTVQELRAGLRDFSNRHMPPSQGHDKFGVIPVSAIGLSFLDARLFGDTSLTTLSSLTLLDILVLAVACFNYASLASALALRSGREAALCKVVGAQRWQLALQNLLEAGAVALIAWVLAMALVIAAAPVLDAAFSIDLQLGQLTHGRFWLFLGPLLLTTTLLAGTYPAIVLSRLRPARALRSDVAITGPRWAFKALSALQFAAAGFLIVLVLVARDQNRHMGEALPGMLRNPTIAITTSLSFTQIDPNTLSVEMAKSPYVRSVSASDQVPWSGGCCWVFNLTRSPDPAQTQIHASATQVGYDFFATTGLRVLAGRAFSRGFNDVFDAARPFTGRRPVNVVIDRSLARELGWNNPADAVGKVIYRPPLWGGVTDALHVIGVVENGAPQLTAVTGTDSNLYLLVPSAAGFPLIRIDPRHVREAIAHIETTWHRLAPHLPLEWRFVDELFGQAYATYSTVSAVATGLTVFAFVIALVGLAGMALHVTAGRRHEIGIRRTIGAKPQQIIELLLLDFTKPIMVANMLAWPFAWLAAHAYLGMFLSRAELTPLPFIASLAATFAITCLAVGSQALRAARVEPAAVLRYQ